MSGKHFKAHEVSCCIKYFIFGFNIIFWGVLSNISSITDLGGFDPVWLFLVVGGVMFILGFAGCIGALRENSFLLKFVCLLKFSVFLGIIFFLELTAGVLAFVFKDWIKDQLNFFINNNIRWECCGAFGADDWNLNIYFNCTDSNPSREKCGVPFSCCTKDPKNTLNCCLLCAAVTAFFFRKTDSGRVLFDNPRTRCPTKVILYMGKKRKHLDLKKLFFKGTVCS
uniref:Tetraspanin-5-like n=1 Tax=Haplochromis burtoni TaxID=8153 RepID=A0A3Q2WB76_HAPBU